MRKLAYYRCKIDPFSSSNKALETDRNSVVITKLEEIDEEEFLEIRLSDENPEPDLDDTDENEGEEASMTEKLSKIGWDLTATKTFEAMTARLIRERVSWYLEKEVSKNTRQAKQIWDSDIVKVYKSSSTQPCRFETNADILMDSLNEGGLISQPPMTMANRNCFKLKARKSTTG